jgi:hypothetical protein
VAIACNDNFTNYFTLFVSIFSRIQTLGKDSGDVCEKHHKDRDVSEGNMQSNKPDVIEAPSRTIQVPTNDRRVRYGTVGSGLDLGHLV